MYNKLFTKILDSSIWMEDIYTRLVWITFIAAMDEYGFVAMASPANVAHRAVLPLDKTTEAITKLEGPDPHSSDPENEGRRLERVPGGWIVLNAEKYRKLVTREIIKDQTKKRVQKFREKKTTLSSCNAHVTHGNEIVTPSDTISKAILESKIEIDQDPKNEDNIFDAEVIKSAKPIPGQFKARVSILDWVASGHPRITLRNDEKALWQAFLDAWSGDPDWRVPWQEMYNDLVDKLKESNHKIFAQDAITWMSKRYEPEVSNG